MTALDTEKAILAHIDGMISRGETWLPLEPRDTPENVREFTLRRIEQLEHK